MTTSQPTPSSVPQPPQPTAVQLRPPSRWHDPLRLIQTEAPSQTGRIVLWTFSLLVLALLVWAAFGQLDIIATAEGKLVPQTLVKIVQPAEAGIVRHQEKALLTKAEQERKSAAEIFSKLEQTLPTYKKSADAYARLEKEGFVGSLAAADKQREATEKSKDLDAQRATVAALNATIEAQQKKISQLQSTYKSELQKELADINTRIAQLQPSLDKSIYKEGLMELKAPQDGIIKDLATTTIGAVVQPGTIVMTLVPKDEPLFADVNIKNEDVGFVQTGQSAQIKLAAYPFQKYGMLMGKVIYVGADSTESAKSNAASNVNGSTGNDGNSTSTISIYKARVQLDAQILKVPQGGKLLLTPGMQVVAEINQGKRTVLEYLLSPVQKMVAEAGRER